MEKADRLLSGAGQGLAEMSKAAIRSDAEQQKGLTAVQLLQSGMSPEQVAMILGTQSQKPNLSGLAAAEWENLQRVVDKPIPQAQPEPQVPQAQPDTPIQMGVEEKIKFNEEKV